jgi:hypothetical protein
MIICLSGCVDLFAMRDRVIVVRERPTTRQEAVVGDIHECYHRPRSLLTWEPSLESLATNTSGDVELRSQGMTLLPSTRPPVIH